MPRTLVCFHAHPDDEAIITAGVMAKAAQEGHRVVLVVATRGELGEVEDGHLDAGEALWERRVAETHEAAAILGVARVEFLGYVDSGMMGEATNDEPGCFWRADVDEATARLARILEEEGADALTVYDDHGGYGHPDHIQVHRVGVRAAAKAGTPRVFEATFDRDYLRRLRELAPVPEGFEPPDVEQMNLGVPGDQITTTVDVSEWVERKRAAMVAHASQISPESFFLAMPHEAFLVAFGTEWFIRRGAPAGTAESDLFEGLDGG
jgi:LmbE family N-acetylglucosaminyl deacetylase